MFCHAAGYEDAFNAFGWDAPPHATHPIQNQYPPAHFHRNPVMQQDRQQLHLSMQPRHAFNLEQRHREVGSSDLASAMSLPNSSGTEGRTGAAGGVSRGGLNKRKGGRSKKAAPNDSNAIQRCLEVMEQLLEEEDAEPFAEPVSLSRPVALCSVPCCRECSRCLFIGV